MLIPSASSVENSKSSRQGGIYFMFLAAADPFTTAAPVCLCSEVVPSNTSVVAGANTAAAAAVSRLVVA